MTSMQQPLVRVATQADAEAMLGIYGPVVRDTGISFEEERPSLEEFRRRVAETGTRYPWLVALWGDSVIGYCYAGPWRPRASYRWTCETSLFIAEGHRGRGVGDALYAALFSALRRMGMRTAMATISLPNPGSLALHRRLGFVEAGRLPAAGYKLGEWRDVVWWRKPLLPTDGPPAEPVWFPSLPAGDVEAWCAAAAARIAARDSGAAADAVDAPPVLRPATDADGDAIASLIRSCYDEYPGCVLDVEGESPELRAPASAYASRGGAFFVAEQGGSVVGCVGWTPEGADSAEIHLEKLYVSARARRWGLGGRLATLVEEIARGQGAKAISLWSDTRFTDAHRFYERRGYVRGEGTRALHDLSDTVEYPFRRTLE